MTRVLSTQLARDSVARMRSIVNGGLTEQIQALSATGQTLSSPEVWDGVAATQFRTTWEQAERSLREAQRQLEALRADVDRINSNIMHAGGNG